MLAYNKRHDPGQAQNRNASGRRIAVAEYIAKRLHMIDTAARTRVNLAAAERRIVAPDIC
jgi:hypothetical protein